MKIIKLKVIKIAYLLTLDVGTTSVKASVYNKHLNVLSISIQEYELLTPGNGIVEIPADTYWEAAVRGIRKVLCESGIPKDEIEVITCTTQGETLIPVTREGNTLSNAIVWLDGRAVEEAEFINKRFLPKVIYSVTGLPEITALCPVSKVLWLKKNRPDVYANAYKILLLEDYLIMKLTGEFVTNPALMCSTGYFNINSDELWHDVIKYCGLDADKFPNIVECGKKVALLSKNAAFEFGVPRSVSVSTGAMDQVASAVGAGNIKEGIVTETTGTALVVTAFCKEPDYGNSLKVTFYRHAVKGKYLLTYVNQTAGIILKWFKDEFCKDLSAKCNVTGSSVYEEMDKIALEVPPLSNGLILFPHLTGTQYPEMNSSVRGVFLGVGLNVGRKHFIRSILESVGYMLRENIEAFNEMGVDVKEIRSLGGGARSKLWIQIKADINDKIFVTMEHEESTSVGAAILGGLSVGLFDNLEAACKLIKRKSTIEPKKENIPLYDQAYFKYRKIYFSIKPFF